MVHTVLQYVPFLPSLHAIKMLTPEGSRCKNRTTNSQHILTHLVLHGSVTEEELFKKKS